MAILFPTTLRWFGASIPTPPSSSSLFLSSFLVSSSSRTFTSSSSTSKQSLIFDRKVKSLQRSRVLRHGSSHLSQFEYIHREVVKELLDRLRDITFSGSKPEEEEGEGRRRFDRVLDLGSRLPSRDPTIDKEEDDLAQQLMQIGNIKHLLRTDISDKMAKRGEGEEVEVNLKSWLKEEVEKGRKRTVVSSQMDEEQLGQHFKEKSLDMVFSSLNLHWVNDLPGCFSSIRKSLRDDGLFLGAMFGEFTLQELRNSFLVAEQEREGGISSHTSPFARVSDIGNLLTRNGFTLTTIDSEEFVIEFPDAFALMWELQEMGENNAVRLRRPFVPKETFLSMAAAYQGLYGNPNGTVPATFHIIFWIAWTPHPSQQKPKERGSAKLSLKDLGKVDVLVEEALEDDLRKQLLGDGEGEQKKTE